ncbi:hypothetical protein HK096_006123 [Nowakowskiella sp. JEL0078]|nr:hypothetical protein HK096_006123 [Nowakowskiella sp. JEL0078]
MLATPQQNCNNVLLLKKSAYIPNIPKHDFVSSSWNAGNSLMPLSPLSPPLSPGVQLVSLYGDFNSSSMQSQVFNEKNFQREIIPLRMQENSGIFFEEQKCKINSQFPSENTSKSIENIDQFQWNIQPSLNLGQDSTYQSMTHFTHQFPQFSNLGIFRPLSPLVDNCVISPLVTHSASEFSKFPQSSVLPLTTVTPSSIVSPPTEYDNTNYKLYKLSEYDDSATHRVMSDFDLLDDNYKYADTPIILTPIIERADPLQNNTFFKLPKISNVSALICQSDLNLGLLCPEEINLGISNDDFNHPFADRATSKTPSIRSEDSSSFDTESEATPKINELDFSADLLLQSTPKLEQKQFQINCHSCKEKFSNKLELTKHTKSAHIALKKTPRMSHAKAMAIALAAGLPKPRFPCQHCSRSFSRSDALRRHVRIKLCNGDNPVPTKNELKKSKKSKIVS